MCVEATVEQPLILSHGLQDTSPSGSHIWHEILGVTCLVRLLTAPLACIGMQPIRLGYTVRHTSSAHNRLHVAAAVSKAVSADHDSIDTRQPSSCPHRCPALHACSQGSAADAEVLQVISGCGQHALDCRKRRQADASSALLLLLLLLLNILRLVIPELGHCIYIILLCARLPQGPHEF